MIFIDRREPEELNKEIRHLGVETAYPTHLEYGDLMFEGNGEMGTGAMVALERKKLSDLINSMQGKRLSGHQARGLWDSYDYVFLITEGMWRPGPGGEIEHWGGGGAGRKGGWRPFYSHAGKNAVSYRQLASYLYSMTLRSRSRLREPMRVIRTSTLRETAAQIVALYKNFTDKRWEDHTAHDQIYTPLPIAGYGENGVDAYNNGHRASLLGGLGAMAGGGGGLQPSLTWAMAAQLPGVDQKARLVAEYFKTPMDMVLAGLDAGIREKVDEWFKENPEAAVKEWMKVKVAEDAGDKGRTKSGRRKAGVGVETARGVVKALMGGE